MTIATRQGVRYLLGELGVNVIDDDRVDWAITLADSKVKTATRKRDWETENPKHPDYDTLRLAAEHFAAAFILQGMQDMEDDAKEQREVAKDAIADIQNVLEAEEYVEDEEDVVLERQPFTTRPLNPDAPIEYNPQNGDIGRLENV